MVVLVDKVVEEVLELQVQMVQVKYQVVGVLVHMY